MHRFRRLHFLKGWQEVLVRKRGPRLLALLLPCAILPAFISCTSPQQPLLRAAPEGITLRQEVVTEGLDLFLLMDESGSIYGEAGTDPSGLRYEAAKYLMQNLLVKEAHPTYPHRISVLHFGDVAVASPFVDLIPANANELVAKIPHIGKHLGDTSFMAALQEARRVAEAAPLYNKRHPIFVILTDGEPDDKRRLTITQYFQEIREFRQKHLGEFKFFVIGIDRTQNRARWGRSQRYWEEQVGRENVFFITEMKELYAKYNEVVRRIFEIPEVSPDVVTEEVAFDVQPYLDRQEFHIFPESRQVKLGILKPDQTPVQAQDKGVFLQKGQGYDILTIAEPEPGRWKYRILEGKGRILVLRNPVPFKLRLEEPQDIHPLGKPMLLKARFIKSASADGAGQEIPEHPAYPLAFSAKVLTPKREEINLQFLKNRRVDQLYYADQVVSTPEPGTYALKLTIRGGARFEATSTREVFVRSYPYLDITRPVALHTYPRSDDFTVEVSLKRDGAATDPDKEFESHPNNLILAQLKSSPEAVESQAIWLTQEGGRGVFRGRIPYVFHQTGRYAIAVELAATPRVSDRLRPAAVIDRVDFLIAPSLSQKTFQWGGYALIGVLLGGLVWGASLALWLFRSPKTVANIDVREEGTPVCTRYLNGSFLKPLPFVDRRGGRCSSGSGPGMPTASTSPGGACGPFSPSAFSAVVFFCIAMGKGTSMPSGA